MREIQCVCEIGETHDSVSSGFMEVDTYSIPKDVDYKTGDVGTHT